MEGKRVQKPEPVAASCNGFLFWKTRDQVPEGGIYVPGRISRDFDVFLAPRPLWSLGAGLIWKQKGGYGTPKPAANGCSGPFLETPGRMPGKESTSSEEFRGISTFSSHRDRPGAWVRGRFGSKKEDMKPRNPLQTAVTGSLESPGPDAERGNLRPRKNFAGFRRFPRAETALEPGCGAGLEAKRSFLENPGPDAGKGIYVLGRISRDFDDFLRRGPPCGLGAEAAFEAKMGYETPKPAANGCNGSFFGKPRTDCRKGKSTSSEEFRGISTFSSEDTAVVGRIRANRPVRNTGLRQRRDKLCSGSRCFPGTVDKREESFYDK